MGETSSRDKERITYLHFDVYMDQLVDMIKKSHIIERLKYVYGIPRGGLPIAVHLSHHLDLELLQLTNIFTKSIKELLVVDDIADTGKTLKVYDYWFPTATLYYKPRSIYKPTFYVRETTKWIVFPWEKEDEVPNRPE